MSPSSDGITLNGGSLTSATLHAIGSGVPVHADPSALAAMAVNAASAPTDGGILRAKRRWLVGEHARSLDDASLPVFHHWALCRGR